MLTLSLTLPAFQALADFPADPVAPGMLPQPQLPPLAMYHDKPVDFSKVPASRDIAAPRVMGNVKIIMLCIKFTNVQNSTWDAVPKFQGMLDGPTNSMKTYYAQASYTKLNISGNVYGWYNSTRTMEYYGAPSGGETDNPQLYKLVSEALTAADPAIDFSQYDVDQDGWIDYLMIIHAGADQAISSNPNDIWSHKYYNFDTPTVDGKKVGWYSMCAETDPLGVWSHEYGHQLGLPDLYDTDGGGSGGETCGAGLWDVMAAGSFNNFGNTPALPSAWSRVTLGWANVVNITSSTNGIQLREADQCNTVIRVNIPDLSTEYFLIENREQVGYDNHLPGSGLLIWHIDERQGGFEANNLEVKPGKKHVTLEEAHGFPMHLDNITLGNLGDYRDAWFNTAGGFNPISNPNTTAAFDGYHSFISVKNISGSSGTMTFDVQLGTKVIDLRLKPDTTSMKVDPGFTTPLPVLLQNYGSAEDFTLVVEGGHPDWFSVDTPSLHLDFRGEVYINISIHPPLTTTSGTLSQNTFKASANSDQSKVAAFSFSTTINIKYRSAVTPSQDILVKPGERRPVNLTLSNLGNVNDIINLTITGDGIPWVDYTGPTQFALSAWKNTTVQLFIILPWSSLGNAKSYVVIGGNSKDGSKTAQAMLNLTAASAPFMMFEGDPELHAKPGVTASWKVKLTNAGTSDGNFILSTSADTGWYANLTLANLEIPAWSYDEATVAITPPLNAAAGSASPVNLTATAGQYSNTTAVNVIVDHVYGARIVDGNTTCEIAPGASYDFKLTLQNTGNGQDMMKFSITEGEGGNGWAESLDIASATLAAGANRTLVLTITAPAGGAAGQEWPLTLTVEHGDSSLTTFNLVSKVARVRALTISAGTKAKTGLPGEDVQFSLQVGNSGNAPDTAVLSAPKVTGLKIEFSVPTLDIAAGGTASLLVTCKIETAALAGLRYVNVTASSQSLVSVNATADLKLTVSAIYGSQLAFKETRKGCDAGKTVGFQFTLVNKGNSQDTFTLARSSGTLAVMFDKSSVTLKPGESANLTANISIQGGESGGAKTVKIVVRSAGKAADLESKELTVDVKAKGIGGTPGFEAQLLALALCGVALLAWRRRWG